MGHYVQCLLQGVSEAASQELSHRTRGPQPEAHQELYTWFPVPFEAREHIEVSEEKLV